MRSSFLYSHTRQIGITCTDATMHLTKPKQGLREDLKEAAATLKWAGLDLFAVANRMQSAGDEKGANELMEIARSFQEVDDNLETHSVSQVKQYSNKVV